MAARLGIELGSVSCRILDVEAPDESGASADSCVRSFNRYPRFGRELREALDALTGRPTALVVWGLAAEHTQATVACGPYAQMRREALAQRAPSLGAGRRVADIAPATAAPDGATRRVVLASAPAAAVAAAAQPFLAAGLKLRSVVTPAAALMSLARRRPAVRGALEVYVALAETATAIALVRDGALIAGHEMPWGYLDPDRSLLVRRKSEVAAYLAAHLETMVDAIRPAHGPVAAVYVCGGFPELRTMTTSLIECLDVEVEPLDSFFGIDETRLPEEGLTLHDRAAEVRLAWGAAIDWPAPLDLLRERRQQQQRAWIARAAVVAGMATGLGLGVALESSRWGFTAIPVAAAAAPDAAERAPLEPQRRPEPSSVPRPESPLESRRERAPALAAAEFVRSYEPPPDLVYMAAASAPRPVAVTPAPAPAPPPVAAPAPVTRTAAAPAPARTAAPSRPFTAELQTILYGPERKLAVIDGRILQQGDEIDGARVVEITATAVVVRDEAGRLTRLHVGQSSR